MPYSARYPQGQVLDRADHPAMIEAIVWLSRERIAFARVSAHQLKIGRTLSFYPVKGTIIHDRQKPLPQRGLAALQALLRHPARDATPKAAAAPYDPTSQARPQHTQPHQPRVHAPQRPRTRARPTARRHRSAPSALGRLTSAIKR